MGIFFSEYLEGVPNSKIFTLSQAIYDSLSTDLKEVLDEEETALKPLDKEQVKELHESLASKNYNQVRELVKGRITKDQGGFQESLGDVPKDVFITMHQDPDHDYASDERVAVRRSDGRITFGFVFLMIDDRIVVNLPEGIKSSKKEDIWHF